MYLDWEVAQEKETGWTAILLYRIGSVRRLSGVGRDDWPEWPDGTNGGG